MYLIIAILSLLVVTALAILIPSKKNIQGISFNNMSGPQDGLLNDDEKNVLADFTGFLEENLNTTFEDHRSINTKIDLRPSYYNVNPGYKGVLKRNDGKRWVFYEIGDELKKVEELKDFDTQIEAFKHLASKFELVYVPGETTTIKNSFEM